MIKPVLKNTSPQYSQDIRSSLSDQEHYSSHQQRPAKTIKRNYYNDFQAYSLSHHPNAFKSVERSNQLTTATTSMKRVSRKSHKG